MSKSTLLASRRPRKAKSVRNRAAASAAAIYAVHPGIAMVQKWIDELPAKTGRSLDDWLAHIRKAGPRDEKASREWLMSEHRLGANTAWWLAEKAFHPDKLAEDTPAGYLKLAPVFVERMYSGPKEHLRPIHDRLIELARELEGVRICPCETMVPLYRRHVFAQIKPTTNKRVDLGLALAEEPFTSRLLDTGGRAKKDRITHRVALTSLDDIDLQVRRWLKQAYERDA
ncbi:MAG TPA: DUF5655 domain-containing protein [Pirellulaceae bacterium]|nr:DUF5655 domain-containing protein [Pirellulaceae bacterium]